MRNIVTRAAIKVQSSHPRFVLVIFLAIKRQMTANVAATIGMIVPTQMCQAMFASGCSSRAAILVDIFKKTDVTIVKIVLMLHQMKVVL